MAQSKYKSDIQRILDNQTLHLIPYTTPNNSTYYIPGFRISPTIQPNYVDRIATFYFGPVTVTSAFTPITRYTSATPYTDFSTNNSGTINYNGTTLDGYDYTVCINSSNTDIHTYINTYIIGGKTTYSNTVPPSTTTGCAHQFIYLDSNNQIIIQLYTFPNTNITPYTVTGTVTFTYKPSILFSFAKTIVPAASTITLTQYTNPLSSPDFTLNPSTGIITFKGSKTTKYNYSVCSTSTRPGGDNYIIITQITPGSPIQMPYIGNSECNYTSITLNSNDQILIQIKNQTLPSAPITCNGTISFSLSTD